MLDADALDRAVREARIPFSVRCLNEVASTNEEVKRLIGTGGSEGAVVTSIVQTGGYGRQGRRWASPAGGLYLSVLLRPLDHGVLPEHLPPLSLVIALAVREVLQPYAGGESISVKWPNDVLCPQGKLCGISLEAIGGAVCAGIGINVFAPDEPPATKGAFPPAYLWEVGGIGRQDVSCGKALDEGVFGFDSASDAREHECGCRELLCECAPERTGVLEKIAAELLRALDGRYARWVSEGFGVFLEEYESCAFLTGRTVGILSMGGDIVAEGRVVRIDERGNLVLCDATGREHTVSSGEAHVAL